MTCSVSLVADQTKHHRVLEPHPHIPIPISLVNHHWLTPLLLRFLQLAPLRLDHMQGGRQRSPWSRHRALWGWGMVGIPWRNNLTARYCQSLLGAILDNSSWKNVQTHKVWGAFDQKLVRENLKIALVVCPTNANEYTLQGGGPFILIVSHSHTGHRFASL